MVSTLVPLLARTMAKDKDKRKHQKRKRAQEAVKPPPDESHKKEPERKEPEVEVEDISDEEDYGERNPEGAENLGVLSENQPKKI